MPKLTTGVKTMTKPIFIEVITEWMESLFDCDEARAIQILELLRRHEDTLFDYIDDAIKEMVSREGGQDNA